MHLRIFQSTDHLLALPLPELLPYANMARMPEYDFKSIRSHEGSQDFAFEEFCCQLARQELPAPGSQFVRVHGAGGDGGVECYWRLPNGDEWGWQAKYLFGLNKKQITDSLETALRIHPKLTHYVICQPIDLTDKTSRKGQSNRERIDEWIGEWSDLAQSQGRSITFKYLGKSELLDRLVRLDSTGGCRAYWFDSSFLSQRWFDSRLKEALAAAGPRYTPDLSIKVGLSDALEALGHTAGWSALIETILRRLRKACKWWEHTQTGADWSGEPSDFPDDLRNDAEAIVEHCRRVEDELSAFATEPKKGVSQGTGRVVKNALETLRYCEVRLRQQLRDKYGEAFESASWRQFKMEYDVSHPTRHLETASQLIDVLTEIEAWIESPAGIAPEQQAILVTGSAGVGKTHSLCDAAVGRNRAGLHSILLHGKQFSEGAIWDQIRSMLGIAPALSQDAIIAALEAAAESTGHPLVIFVDALNETEARGAWKRHLASFVAGLRNHEWLRLCISCRTSYLEDVLPDGLLLYKVEHTGFADVEFDSLMPFFNHYGIRPPAVPPLQEEFSNPLLLKLTCETIQHGGGGAFPAEMLGVTELAKRVVDAKDAEIAKRLDYDPHERFATRGIEALAEAMLKDRSRFLVRSDALAVTRAIWPKLERSTGLLHHLVHEGLLLEERLPGNTQDVIRFSFDRIGDHLLASRVIRNLSSADLETAFGTEGILAFALSDDPGARGVLEALAVLIPERFNREIVDILPETFDVSAGLRLVLSSLPWRDPRTLSGSLPDRIQAAMRSLTAETLDALFTVVGRPGVPVNAELVNTILKRFPLAQRDAFWCQYLHLRFGKQNSLDRLLRWALKSDMSGLDPEVARLIGVALSWCCAAADRRVRDHATKGLVRLLEAQPLCIEALVERFARIDDEYILERILAATYGVMIRRADARLLAEAALVVHHTLFASGTPPTNAMIRDYGRFILELALDRGLLPAGVEAASFRPPYKSPWPLEWPTKEWMEQFDEAREELPKLKYSCLEDDFAVYTLESHVNKYPEVKLIEAGRWVFREVLNLGYLDSGCNRYDGYMLYQYGSGRGRPQWAERIGKKYQWIALYRLIGIMGDHLRPTGFGYDRRPSLSVPEAQAESERNIDPTILIPASRERQVRSWWAPVEYDFSALVEVADADWMKRVDWPDSRRVIEVTDRQGVTWLLLEVVRDWDARPRWDDEDDFEAKRRVWMMVRSYLVPKGEAEQAWRWLGKQDFMGDWMPTGDSPTYVYMGEYPFLLPSRLYFESMEGQRYVHPDVRFTLTPTWADMISNFDFDSYRTGPIRITVPSRALLEGTDLHWDGISGYRQGSADDPVLFDPCVEEAGPGCLLVRKEWLGQFLKEHDLELMWTVLAEKVILSYSGQRTFTWPEMSRAHRWNGEGEIQSSKPKTKLDPELNQPEDDAHPADSSKP